MEEVEENLNPNLDQSQTGQQTPSPTKKSRNFSGGLTFFKNFEKFFMKIKKKSKHTCSLFSSFYHQNYGIVVINQPNTQK